MHVCRWQTGPLEYKLGRCLKRLRFKMALTVIFSSVRDTQDPFSKYGYNLGTPLLRKRLFALKDHLYTTPLLSHRKKRTQKKLQYDAR